MKDYYRDRAGEYDQIYTRAERQSDIRALTQLLCDSLTDKHVLEIACGTGFWTDKYHHLAQEVLALDYNHSVLELARARDYGESQVSFIEADAYQLARIAQLHNACFAGFWLSHVKRDDISAFLSQLRTVLTPGSTVIFADNRYVPGNSTPICRTDTTDNTYQMRSLKDGSQHEILKNFISEAEIRGYLGDETESFEFIELEYFWCCRYRVS